MDSSNLKAQDLGWITRQIAAAQDTRFFGSITINLNDGQIQNVTRQESLKPPRPGMRVDSRP